MTADGVQQGGAAKALLVGLFLAWAIACPGVAGADETSEIAAQRAAAQSRYVEREQACRDRFAVTACIDAARRERRMALDALRSRQLVIDQQRRQQRADARRKELAEKSADDARRGRSTSPEEATAPASASRVAAPAPTGTLGKRVDKPEKAERGPRSPPTPVTPRKPKQPAPAATRTERERANRKIYDEKQRAVLEHREQSIDATLRRLSGKPPAASLPVPAAPARPASS